MIGKLRLDGMAEFVAEPQVVDEAIRGSHL
jgi:hypothetical protein